MRTKESLSFKSYPGGGKERIGSPRGASCRREYGLRLTQIAGQHTCAYCGADFTSAYEFWLTMALDHVVPTHTARGRARMDDASERLAGEVRLRRRLPEPLGRLQAGRH